MPTSTASTTRLCSCRTSILVLRGRPAGHPSHQAAPCSPSGWTCSGSSRTSTIRVRGHLRPCVLRSATDHVARSVHALRRGRLPVLRMDRHGRRRDRCRPALARSIVRQHRGRSIGTTTSVWRHGIRAAYVDRRRGERGRPVVPRGPTLGRAPTQPRTSRCSTRSAPRAEPSDSGDVRSSTWTDPIEQAGGDPDVRRGRRRRRPAVEIRAEDGTPPIRGARSCRFHRACRSTSTCSSRRTPKTTRPARCRWVQCGRSDGDRHRPGRGRGSPYRR